MNTNNETTTLNTNTTTSTNTTFLDQAPEHQEYAQQNVVDVPAPQVMPDEAWFAAKQLSKPIIVQTVQWESTQLFNATLWSAGIPDIISSFDSIQRRTLQMYAFYRMNVKLRVQLNGTPFHQGQFVLGFVPFDMRLPDTPGLPGYFSVVGLTGFPSIQVSAATAESSELTIPFIHLYDYLMSNTINDVTLGTVYLKVLNPLRYSTGASPALTITISMYADSPEVHVPMYDHTVLYTESVECEPTGLFSNIGAAVGHLSTGNLKGFFKSGSKAQSDMSDLFDKPEYIATPQKTISPLSAMSHGKGTDTTIRLGLDPSALSVKPSDVFGGVTDEMTIEHITQTPLLFHQFGWTDMALNGAVLTSFYLNPRLSYVQELTPRAIFQPTYLAWVSSMYSFWRGGLKFHLDIISTQFHSGRMLIAYIPNVNATPPTLSQAYSCPNVIVDIKTTSKVDFVVPYLSNVPYKTVDAENASQGTLGQIFIYVLNQLVHPDNVAPEIEVNMYISAADDFELSVPREFPLYLAPISEECEPTGDVGDVQQTKTESGSTTVSMAYGSMNINRLNRFGEDFPLIDYIKRYGVCDGFSQSHDTFDVSPSVNFHNTPTDKYTMSPVAAVAQIFASWYGSLRYKFIFDAPRTAENIAAISLSTGATTVYNLGTPFQVTSLSQDNGMEVTAPCYTPYNLLVSPGLISGSPDIYKRSGVLDLTQSAGTKISPKSYMAAGDDLRFFYMISPPTVLGPLFGVTT